MRSYHRGVVITAGAALHDELELVLRLEYRVRYYNRRDDALKDETVHGTQNFTPFVGVCWKFGGGNSEIQTPDDQKHRDPSAC